jgi:hypothetical protein
MLLFLFFILLLDYRDPHNKKNLRRVAIAVMPNRAVVKKKARIEVQLAHVIDVLAAHNIVWIFIINTNSFYLNLLITIIFNF